MIITLYRFALKATHTIGDLLIDGKYLCNILELPVDGDGTKPMTAIAPGMYKVKPIQYNGKPALEILNVKGRTGILMHIGNTVKDSKGCLLPGINNNVGVVVSSGDFMNIIYDKVVEAEKNKDKIYINVLQTLVT